MFIGKECLTNKKCQGISSSYSTRDFKTDLGGFKFSCIIKKLRSHHKSATKCQGVEIVEPTFKDLLHAD